MSGGGSISYHLRHNKAIDRNLFIELLRRINGVQGYNISDYQYIGFGGPFLEDFKQIHSHLRVSDMISIECDANVLKRQKFNVPVSCIQVQDAPIYSGEFIDKNDFDKRTIFWLDYAIPKDLNSQLHELRRLISKLSHGCIFKITVNASAGALGSPQGGQDLKEYRAMVLTERISTDYLSKDIEPDEVTQKELPTTILRAIKSAAFQGVKGSKDIVVQPLSAFVYDDGTQMLTATGIILSKSEYKSFRENSRLKKWPLINYKWDVPKKISVPSMSARERLFVESMLPNANVSSIHRRLKFWIGDNKKEGVELMRNFKEYYRTYPWFSKIII